MSSQEKIVVDIFDIMKYLGISSNQYRLKWNTLQADQRKPIAEDPDIIGQADNGQQNPN